MFWNPLNWLLSEFNSWLFILIQPLILIYIFFIVGIPLWRYLIQPLKTADLCHHLPTDNSNDFAGTRPTRVLSRLSPSPASFHLGSLWLPLSYSARNGILRVEQKWGLTTLSFIWARCSWKVATGSRNPSTMLWLFWVPRNAQTANTSESALADWEIRPSPTFPQWLPCFMKF